MSGWTDRKHLSFPYQWKCLLIIRTVYPQKYCPATGLFPRIYPHGNMFVTHSPVKGLHVTIFNIFRLYNCVLLFPSKNLSEKKKFMLESNVLLPTDDTIHVEHRNRWKEKLENQKERWKYVLYNIGATCNLNHKCRK
jgi:hypothetical protein